MNKITHLIPATEFILHTVQTPFENEAYSCEQNQIRLDFIYNYAQFLKQPLQEWMLVGEDRLFENIGIVSETEDSWLCKINGNFPRIIGKKLNIESLRIFIDKISLTPKALEQIYGSI